MKWLKKLLKIEEKPVVPVAPKGWQTFCVPNAILCAWTCGVKAGYEVRIAVSHIETGIDHSQAQALINGKWTFLTEIPSADYIMIQTFQSHYPDKEPYRYLTLADWLREQYRYVNQKEML